MDPRLDCTSGVSRGTGGVDGIFSSGGIGLWFAITYTELDDPELLCDIIELAGCRGDSSNNREVAPLLSEKVNTGSGVRGSILTGTSKHSSEPSVGESQYLSSMIVLGVGLRALASDAPDTSGDFGSAL
jgi:hypothetical protein